MRKVVNLLTVTLMFVGMLAGGMGAWADNIVAGPARPEKGDLTIHKYWLEETKQTGTAGTGSIEDGTQQAVADANAVKGIQFDIYQVGDAVTTGAPKVIPGGDGIRYTYDVAKDPKTVTAKDNTGKSYTYNLLPAETAAGAVAFGKTDVSGELKYSDLKAGEYLVIENLAASAGYEVEGYAPGEIEIQTAIAPFVVAVPMTVDEKDGNTNWNTDVHVWPKNRTLRATKEVETVEDKQVPTMGDELEFTIAGTVPELIQNYQQYDIWDILDDGLTWSGDETVKVWISDYVGGKINLLEKITNPAEPAAPYWTIINDSTNTQKYTISFTAEGRKYLAQKGAKNVAIQFTAEINEKAIFDKDATDQYGNIIKNKATVEFTNEHGDQNKIETNETTTPLAELHINKVDRDGKAITSDTAKFVIAATEADAIAEKYIIVKKDTNGKVVDVAYPVDKDYDQKKAGTDGYSGYEDYEVTTDANGYAAFVGLKDKLNVWLVETKAPKGYNLLSGPVEVTAVVANSSDPDAPFNTNEYHITTENVVNSNQFTLPKTGGPGLILLTVAGIIIIGFGIMVAMPKKRKN